jgi:hypothetical protein
LGKVGYSHWEYNCLPVENAVSILPWLIAYNASLVLVVSLVEKSVLGLSVIARASALVDGKR